jgi:parallel beta-helix repeat protein
MNGIITGNTLTNNFVVGLLIWSSSNNNLVTNNDVSSNVDYGIFIQSSNSNTLINNTINSNPSCGILLQYTKNDIFLNNTMVGDGIYLWGDQLEHWNTHVIDTSNTINGKPVQYWKNQIDSRIPSCAGQVILANCSGIVVENQNMMGGSEGIELGFSNLNTIANNTASINNHIGIELYQSHNNIIVNNTASSNNIFGFFIRHSNSNTIINNMALSNWYSGINLYEESNYNTVSNNTVSLNVDHGIYVLGLSNYNNIVNNTLKANNKYGVSICSSKFNTIYHNKLINNINQAYDDMGSNFWNTSTRGNYWSDWYSPDNNTDGIVDFPYNIDGSASAKDYLPIADINPPNLEIVSPGRGSVPVT